MNPCPCKKNQTNIFPLLFGITVSLATLCQGYSLYHKNLLQPSALNFVLTSPDWPKIRYRSFLEPLASKYFHNIFSAICEETNTAVLTGSSVSMTGLYKFNYTVQTTFFSEALALHPHAVHFMSLSVGQHSVLTLWFAFSFTHLNN